jgi:hypothetical protein
MRSLPQSDNIIDEVTFAVLAQPDERPYKRMTKKLSDSATLQSAFTPNSKMTRHQEVLSVEFLLAGMSQIGQTRCKIFLTTE